MQAEHLSLKQNATDQAIMELYVNAANSVARCDMYNIQALACERLADFLIWKGGDGKAYMLDSCCHYASWGASAKARALQNKHSVDSQLLALDWSTVDMA